MFARLFAIASFAALVVATATSGQCNTGTLQCCNSVQQATDVTEVLAVFGLDGILAGVTGQVGLHCSSVTAVGTGSGAKCQQQPICCNDNRMNGLINVGCTPVNANA